MCSSDLEDDALMYAGIFSDKTTYECQIKRLMNREKNLILLYEQKDKLQRERGCDSQEFMPLENLRVKVNSLSDSSELYSLDVDVKNLKEINSFGGCNLW